MASVDVDGMQVPVIENIHQRVWEAASRPGALKMSSWHCCETTHCRAGWVVHLGGEAGYQFVKFIAGYSVYEKLPDWWAESYTADAALRIYSKSSSIKVIRKQFYVSSDETLADMLRCANLERAEQGLPLIEPPQPN